jgi:hypothetical protein
LVTATVLALSGCDSDQHASPISVRVTEGGVAVVSCPGIDLVRLTVEESGFGSNKVLWDVVVRQDVAPGQILTVDDFRGDEVETAQGSLNMDELGDITVILTSQAGRPRNQVASFDGDSIRAAGGEWLHPTGRISDSPCP